MADEKKEPWLNVLALTTVLFAVAATLSTFRGGSFSTKSLLFQSQASDQWAFYQAKAIKGSLYEVEREHLTRELQGLEAGKGSASQLASARKALADTDRRVARYDQEKAEIKKTAEKLEIDREDALRHNRPFGLAVIYLQIAILLSSIAALLKKPPVYWLGLLVGVAGVVYFANGFFLFW